MFLLVCVILFTGGGGLPQCMLGYPPPGSRPPSEADPLKQTPLPPRKQTPPLGSIHTPQKQTPQEADNPPEADTPPSTRSMSGRYTSYWNAFLFDRWSYLRKCTRRTNGSKDTSTVALSRFHAGIALTLSLRERDAPIACFLSSFLKKKPINLFCWGKPPYIPYPLSLQWYVKFGTKFRHRLENPSFFTRRILVFSVYPLVV